MTDTPSEIRDDRPSPEYLRTRLRHVRWIGGGSGAGKTTVAGLLAAEHGLQLYSSDDTMAAHARRISPADAPLLHAFLAMDMDERWANRSPTVMLKTFPWFQGEGFDLIVRDLLALPEEPPIVAEGFRLLPRLVAPLLSRPNQAIWLVPTPDFRRAAFDSRGFTWDIPRKASKPERALSHLLARDQLFTDEVAAEASALHLCLVEINGQQSVEEVKRRVAATLGMSL
ncbi:MAG TPA: hypothetical protein VFU88_00675 [Ktedonobacterales bacterium]|nr:hypothetical protein [Ktedonobacterales bacterium]